jgi:hypothetical protein
MARFTPVVLILDQTLSPPDGREFFLHRLKTSNEDLKTGISSLLKKSFFSDCSKMPPARGGTSRPRCFSPADQAGNPEERGVLGCTPQRRRMRATPQKGVFQQSVSVSPAPAVRPAAHSGCTRGEPPSWGRPQPGDHPPGGIFPYPLLL